MSGIDQILAGYAGLRDAQEEFYKDLHQHPELSHQEQRTARRAVAAYIIGLGGYIATAKTQAGSALTSIRVAAGIIPGHPLPRRSSRHAGLPADREGLSRHRG